MESRKKRDHKTILYELDILKEMYPHDIQMYTEFPKHVMQLHEFLELGLERRQILKMLELILSRSDLQSQEDKKLALINALKKDGYNYAAKLLNGFNPNNVGEFELVARKRDVISHFILRLAYSQSPEYRKWFIVMEVEYMKLKLLSLTKEGMATVLTANNIIYPRVSDEEKEELKEDLLNSTPKITNLDIVDFYRVPMNKVFELIRARKVFIKKGVAYTPQFELSTLFTAYYRRHLTKCIDIVSKSFFDLRDDERIYKFLKELPNYIPQEDRVVWSTTDTPIEALDDLSRTSYPLCMRTLHEALKTNNHLKNFGRMQYTLFLKGIGVSLENAIQFFRVEFTKKMEPDKFEKSYSYGVKFYYGNVGSRRNYTPMGCMKIISSLAGAGEYHGCPYRLMDEESLRKKLTAYGLPSSGISEVVELKKDHQYNLACAKFFEVTHNVPPEHPVMHPNIYYKDSRSVFTKTSNPSDVNGSQTPQQSSKMMSRVTPKANNTPKSNWKQTPKVKNDPGMSVDSPSRTPARKKLNVQPLDIEKLLSDEEFDEFSIDL